MLRVPVHKIEPGMVLARPIALAEDSRCFLLQRDTEIPLDLVPRLIRMGVRDVWVRCRDLEFLESLFDDGVDQRQREVYAQVRRNFEAVMHGAALELDIARFETSIAGLFDCLRTSRHGNVLLEKLDAFDNYLMSHSTNVCYLAMLLGLKLDRYLIGERRFKTARDAKDVQHLGLGCLLHDVGKMRIPPELLNKPGKLTAEEQRLMQTHPTVGYEMVRGRVPASAANVVLCHHQRWNGEGYPERLDKRTGEKLPPMRGRQIPIFARIATVVDVYDAATSARVYSPAKQPVRVLHEMRTWCRGFFDPVIEQAFREIVPPFPIGRKITLSDGVEGVVVDFNPRQPTRPKVRCLRTPTGERIASPGDEEIDLALYPDLSIHRVEDVDVRPFLATADECDTAQRELAHA